MQIYQNRLKNSIFDIYNSYKYSPIGIYSFLHEHELNLPVMSFFNTLITTYKEKFQLHCISISTYNIFR